MIKFYSDMLDKWFDSSEEATAAEETAMKSEEDAKLKIAAIEAQRIKEIAEIDKELDKKNEELEKLMCEIDMLKSNRSAVDMEANTQISELSPNKPDKFNFNFKMTDSTDPSKCISYSTDSYDEFKKKFVDKYFGNMKKWFEY